jgi:hypothetical protein
MEGLLAVSGSRGPEDGRDDLEFQPQFDKECLGEPDQSVEVSGVVNLDHLTKFVLIEIVELHRAGQGGWREAGARLSAFGSRNSHPPGSPC